MVTFCDSRALRLMMEQFNEVGDRWIKKLLSVADGRTNVDMSDSLCRVTLDCIGKVCI